MIRELPNDQLVLAAGALMALTAVIHVLHGVVGLAESLVVHGGVASLPAMLLLAGVLTIALMWAFHAEALPPLTCYVLGALLMAGMLAAYADWHVLGFLDQTAALEGRDPTGAHGHDAMHDHGHDHGHGHEHHEPSPVEILAAHLRDDLTALVAKLAEAGAAACCAVLTVRELRKW